MRQIHNVLKPYQHDIPERHLDVLDGVRAILILMVAWFHIWQQSWLSPYVVIFGQYISLDFVPRAGYMMVDGMLLLSALLLYYPIACGQKIDVWRFYKKRLIRILPSYLLCLLLTIAFVVIPENKYGRTEDFATDLISHLTFTQMFSYPTYITTPLNGALWTVAIEMQFYLIFPLLALCFRKKPVITFCVMCAVAFAYRAYVHDLPDTTVYINQLPAFMDVFAIGFAAARLIKELRTRMTDETRSEKLLFTAIFIASVVSVIRTLQDQAGCYGYENIRFGQLENRFKLACALALMMISLCFSLPAFRFIFGNKVMSFLSAISFQFYMYHQIFAVKLKTLGIPASDLINPWEIGEIKWQKTYTFLAFGGSFAIAIMIYLLFEKPITKFLKKKIV